MRMKSKCRLSAKAGGWLLLFTVSLFFPLVVFSQSSLTGVVLRDANLRAGPGTTYAIAGKATAGQTVQIVAKSAAGDWYQLDNKAWIAAFLVKLNPVTVMPTPIAKATSVMTATATVTTTQVNTPTTSVLTNTATLTTTHPVTTTPTVAAPTPSKTLVRQLAKVTSINSGDTIHVSLNGKIYKVRYLLINAPSSKELLSNEATEANRLLVKDKEVYLVKDVSDTDKEGNLLRYIYLQNGTFVNAELVRRGYALLTTFSEDMAKEPEILAAQQEAINNGRGLWAAHLPKTSAAATPSAPVATAVANRAANIRACPGTNCAISGHVTSGQSLKLIARSADKAWYQLENGSWIAAFLVNNAPSTLSVAPAKPAATPTPVH
ncbi:MAG: SH3 domain-containing protein [Caldilineaceae bacterium]